MTFDQQVAALRNLTEAIWITGAPRGKGRVWDHNRVHMQWFGADAPDAITTQMR